MGSRPHPEIRSRKKTKKYSSVFRHICAHVMKYSRKHQSRLTMFRALSQIEMQASL
jgi:hypothetical protein